MHRLLLLPALAVGSVVGSVVGMAGCSADESGGALDTLPPIRTTTSTTSTTVFEDQLTRVYTVKQGENLSLIARSFEVPLDFLIEANEDVIDDPNNVPPGVTLKIPPFRMFDELPTPSSTEAP